MANHVEIDGHPTWVDDGGGAGGAVLLLHGGLGDSGLLAGVLGSGLEEAGFRVVSFDRRGHGRTADTGAPFHYADMADETIAVLEQVVGGPAHLVGFSDGGNIALLVALARPELVTSIVPISANYSHDGIVLDIDPDDPALSMIADGYAAVSPDGAEHFPVVLEKALTMFASEPSLTTSDLARITAPALVMAGDDDAVLLSHTTSLFEALPAATTQLAIVPGTSHLLPLEKPELVSRLVLDFLTAVGPVTTFMPIRRR